MYCCWWQINNWVAVRLFCICQLKPRHARVTDTHAMQSVKIYNSLLHANVNNYKQEEKRMKSRQHTSKFLRKLYLQGDFTPFLSPTPKSLSLLQVPWTKHKTTLTVDNVSALLKKRHNSGETQCDFHYAPGKTKYITHPPMWRRMPSIHWPPPDLTYVWKWTACSFPHFLLQDEHSIENT